MNEHLGPESEYDYVMDSPKYRVTRVTFIVVCCALMVAVPCMLVQIYRLNAQVAALQRELDRSRGSVSSEVTKVRELSSLMANSNRNTIKNLRDELDEARRNAEVSAGQARQEAQNNVQRLARQLQAEEQKQRELHEEVRKAQAATEQVATAADAKLADVKNEVGTVKHEVAQAQNSISKAVSDLRRVIGDMGVMSGRIATNQQELEILKALGDRNYTEFRISKAKEPKTVNGVRLALKKTDAGSRKFTLEVVADEQKVQKKDRNVNEPVQFYVGHRKQPYEIVVNEVTKNEVVGYMATPKLDLDRN